MRHALRVRWPAREVLGMRGHRRCAAAIRASTAFALSTGDRDRDCGAGVVAKSPIRKHPAVTVTAHRQICGGLSSVTVLDQAVLLDCNLTGWPKMAGNIPV